MRILLALVIFAFTLQLGAQNANFYIEKTIVGDTSLIISYQLPPLPAGNQYEEIILVVSMDNEIYFPNEKFLSGDIGKKVTPGKNKRIEWAAGKELTGMTRDKLKRAVVKIKASKGKGKYIEDFNIQPFVFKEKVPFYAVGLVGLGMTGGGLYLLKESQDLQEELNLYTQASNPYWNDTPSEDDCNCPAGRDGVNQDREQFAVIGTAAAIGGLTILAIDLINYRKRQKLQKSMEKMMAFYPVFDVNGSAGIGLTIRF